jgi:hypothetical protein
MNTVAITAADNIALPILTGVTAVSITSTSGSTPITLAPITSLNYFVDDVSGVLTLNTFGSTASFTNNYTTTATNIIFFNSANEQISSINSINPGSFTPIPTNSTYATLDDLGSNLTIPIIATTNSTIFNGYFITNQATLTASLNYFGTVNNNSNQLLNNSPISIPTNASTPILSGANNTVSVYLIQNDTTYILQPNTPYYIDYINGTWSLNTYSSSAALFNNFNATITGLTFNNVPNPIPQQLNYHAYAPIPTNSTTTSFTDFYVPFTLPVVATQTSNIFSPSVLNNTSDVAIGIITYGTVGGIPDTAFNTTPGYTGAQPLPAQQAVNIFTGATSLQIFDGSTMVLDTSTLPGLYPLPLNQSYNVIDNSGVWSIEPVGPTLMNNFNEPATAITFFDAFNNVVPSSSSSAQPWASVSAPATTFYAQVTYDPSGTIYSILQNTSSNIFNSLKIFTNTLLINNSDTDVTVTYYYTNIAGIPSTLNATQFPLQAGDAIPFITGTNGVDIFADGQQILSNRQISSTLFYEIQNAITTKSLRLNVMEELRAASPDIEPSSSALGVLRFLGGQTPTPPNIKAVYLYAQNPSLFKQYLYIDLYVQAIVNSTAQQAAKNAVNLIVDNYAINYRNQPDFNYISYFYLLNDQLAAAQATLVAQYPTSTTQINRFFTYIQKRITTLLA